MKNLHVLVSYPKTFLHVKFYNINEKLTAVANFYELSPHNIQNMKAANNFQDFPCSFPNNTCHQNFAIMIIYSFHVFSIVRPGRFHMQQMFFTW